MCFAVLGLLGSAMAVRAVEGEQYIPSDTQAVVTVNFKQLLDAPSVKKDIGKLKEAIKGVGEAQKILDDLGFDPLKDLNSVVIAGVGAGNPEKVTILVNGKFDVQKFTAHAEKAAKEHGDHLKTHKVGQNTVYEASPPNSPKNIFAGLVDDKTIVLALSKEDVAEAFDVKAGKKKAELNKELKSLMDKTAGKAFVSVAALGGALGNEVPFGDKVTNIQGGITVSDDVKLDFTIGTKDADSAKGLAELLKDGLDRGKNIIMFLAMTQKELAPASELMDTLKVGEKGNSVTLTGVVTKEKLEQLQKEK
jgi:hypothetical protein